MNIVLVLFPLLFLFASAEITGWTGETGTSLWSDSGNWNTSRIPGEFDDVYIPVTSTVILDVDAHVNNVYLANLPQGRTLPAHLMVVGGTLTVKNRFESYDRAILSISRTIYSPSFLSRGVICGYGSIEAPLQFINEGIVLVREIREPFNRTEGFYQTLTITSPSVVFEGMLSLTVGGPSLFSSLRVNGSLLFDASISLFFDQYTPPPGVEFDLLSFGSLDSLSTFTISVLVRQLSCSQFNATGGPNLSGVGGGQQFTGCKKTSRNSFAILFGDPQEECREVTGEEASSSSEITAKDLEKDFPLTIAVGASFGVALLLIGAGVIGIVLYKRRERSNEVQDLQGQSIE